MSIRVVSLAAARRTVELARNGLPPEPIRELMEDIQGDLRVAELREVVTGRADPDLATAISHKKRRLDGMYLDWIEGKSVSSPIQE